MFSLFNKKVETINKEYIKKSNYFSKDIAEFINKLSDYSLLLDSKSIDTIEYMITNYYLKSNVALKFIFNTSGFEFLILDKDKESMTDYEINYFKHKVFNLDSYSTLTNLNQLRKIIYFDLYNVELTDDFFSFFSGYKNNNIKKAIILYIGNQLKFKKLSSELIDILKLENGKLILNSASISEVSVIRSLFDLAIDSYDLTLGLNLSTKEKKNILTIIKNYSDYMISIEELPLFINLLLSENNISKLLKLESLLDSPEINMLEPSVKFKKINSVLTNLFDSISKELSDKKNNLSNSILSKFDELI